MCSIIGYSGNEVAAPIIVKGLKRMEYRGYDSVGVATESNNQIELKKGIGKVNEVNSKIQLDTLPGKTGIGHTRWATHGKVTEFNAHPHPSNSGKIAIVHNGIIENFEGKVEDNNQTTILGLNDEQLALVADHLTMSIMQDIVDPRQLLDDDVINNDLIDLVGALPVVDDDEVYGVGEVGKLIKYFNLFLDYHELIEDIDTGIQTLQQRTRFISELLFIHNEFPENFRIRGPIQTKIRALNEMGDLPDEANLRANAELNHNIALLQEREQLECNLCQSLMVIREGANGYFWGCSTFPNCWSTRHLTRDEKDFLGIT